MKAKTTKRRTATSASTTSAATTVSERLFWSLAAKLQQGDARIVEGTIPEPNRKLWAQLLGEGVAFVSKAVARKGPSHR